MKYLTPFLVSILLITSNQTLAATLYIDPATATLHRGDTLISAVRLMPDKENGECINVIDAVLEYSENIQPVDTSIGKSILSVWIEEPTINKEDRTISFAGGIPNGYCGRVDGDPSLTNIIAEIMFRSPGLQIGVKSTSTEAVVSFLPTTQILLNDGQGTKAPLTTYGMKVALENDPAANITDDWHRLVREDDLPPEEFSINLIRDEKGINFNGRYYIIFSTKDKQTGISHYEVMEEPLSQFSSFAWGGVGKEWVKANSPYILDDQTLNSTIRVRAFDKAGNEYVATLVPDESLRSDVAGFKNNSLNMVAIVSIVVLVIIIFTSIYYVRRRKKEALEREVESEVAGEITNDEEADFDKESSNQK
ncbi:MAG: hypothetical protein R3B60_03570 [Candidatus Paceibacterota bacterium]